MSFSIQTNVASLNAQNNIRINQAFQSNTINQLSSGYRINSSADDAAGLAVANKYRGDTAELTQGVLNANNGIAALQIVDGGVNNISTIVDRLRTLATESASSTFTGNRTTLNNEYQGLLNEINRQAANVNLNTNGTYNTKLVNYVGGGSNQANAQVTVDLSGANNAVDTTGLGIATTSVQGGGTEIGSLGVTNTVRLDDAAAVFAAGGHQDFTFHIATSTGNTDVTATVTGGAGGLSGTQVISSLNNTLSPYGISASIDTNGKLQFGGSTAFSVVSVATVGGGNAIATTGAAAINTSNYSLNSKTGGAGAGVFVNFSNGTGASAQENITFQNASGSANVIINTANASTIGNALTALNNALTGTGISAVKDEAGTSISFQSQNAFSVSETYTAATGTGAGNLFGGETTTAGTSGPLAVTGPVPGASNTGAALTALGLLATAVTNLGLIQGTVGGGINKLNYAVNLAQSQITNYSSAQAGIRDADVAAQAANLTKAQVLQQASLAALAQANSAPQAVLSLLKG